LIEEPHANDPYQPINDSKSWVNCLQDPSNNSMDIVIPLTMKGTIISFITRIPTQWEIENTRMIEVTDPNPLIANNVKIVSCINSYLSHSTVENMSFLPILL
jgi:hypothetical protein